MHDRKKQSSGFPKQCNDFRKICPFFSKKSSVQKLNHRPGFNNYENILSVDQKIMECKRMKTKSLVLLGVLIIALAAMAAPVMAADTTGGSAGGTQDVNASVSMNNATVNFGSFHVGGNTISPSHFFASGFPEIVVYSNENQWHINVVGTHDLMRSTEGYTLANPMNIATVSGSSTGDVGSINYFSHDTLSGLTTTTPGTSFIGGTAMDQGNISLSLSQTVIPKDKASSSYNMGITVNYASGA